MNAQKCVFGKIEACKLIIIKRTSVLPMIAYAGFPIHIGQSYGAKR